MALRYNFFPVSGISEFVRGLLYHTVSSSKQWTSRPTPRRRSWTPMQSTYASPVYPRPVPCSAEGGGEDDGRGIPTSICHILDVLSRWNRFLWHVGLQLRELRGPGKLSLVRVAYGGSGGCRQEAQSQDARFLVYVLLVQHRCVESAHVDELLIEGSGLGEYRERVVSALRKDKNLRTLTLGSVFGEYRSIREDLFGAISTMAYLRELVVLGSGAAPPVLIDAICALLDDTMCLITLSMSGLALDAESGRRLIAALDGNDTVGNLSVHGSIVHSYLESGVSRFTVFLANSLSPSSVSVEGMPSSPERTYSDLSCIITPAVLTGKLKKLRLTGYLLDAQCAALLSPLVSRKDGRLESLDISGCRWRTKSPPERQYDARPGDGRPSRPRAGLPGCPWLLRFDYTARTTLSSLALSYAGLRPSDLWYVLCTARAADSVQEICLKHVSLRDLKEVCRVIRESGMSSKVLIEGAHFVDAEALNDLRQFPEALRKVAISSVGLPSPKAFGDTVIRACSWYQVTTLNLVLTQDVISDVATFHKLSNYIKRAAMLRALALTGCGQPDLSRTLRPTGQPHCLLLDAILKNKGVRALRFNGLRLGPANLWFLVDELATSKTVCEVSFVSWDAVENDTFVLLLAADIRRNDTVTHLRIAESVSAQTEEDRFVIEDLIGRNLGYITCAAHYVVYKDRLQRCEAAYAAVGESPFLKKKVRELLKEIEETGSIESILE
ncbi:hypothetical protein HPB50_002083 [Hyalomma asiaticum]|uniref:Uncharacterized protein n=1 Tax=Hyalomma asiaticum TaxID=266040 RepID=A0ACB7T5N7_HYAAI|nr:hypothetical protein HPB50_002083 [Hyalomma asiaticum]